MAEFLRIIIDLPASGLWNMAVDQALLEQAAVPTLRLYQWAPPAVSVGRSHWPPPHQLFLRAEQRGYHLVRRLTGGGTILHDDELTYALVAPAARLPQGVAAAFAFLTAAVRDALKQLGLDTQLAKGDRLNHPLCFAQQASGEVTWRGRKLIGSAQARRRGWLLQHGALPLTLDPAVHEAVMAGTVDGTLAARAIGLVEVLRRRPSWEELTQAFQTGFAHTLGLSPHLETLTDTERAWAEQLMAGESELLHAAQVVQQGGVIALPTETVWGVAADLHSQAAVERLRHIKGRAETQPLQILAASLPEALELAAPWAHLALQKLGRAFWPGPLMVIAPASPLVPPWISTGTVGLRIPDHPSARSLLARTGPLAASSANRSGEPPLKSAAAIAQGLPVDAVLDAPPEPSGTASTAFDLASRQVLREGPITLAHLLSTLDG
ncbi:MAG: threonylcarbamoyl-AMP synthase [Deinococcus sp.]|nr:threonylcarbamoyl-AMP synthase [Deinococcus sp.]